MQSFEPGFLVFGSYRWGSQDKLGTECQRCHTSTGLQLVLIPNTPQLPVSCLKAPLVILFVHWPTSKSLQMPKVPHTGRVTGVSYDTSGPLCQWSICIHPTCHLLAPCLATWGLINARGATSMCGYRRDLPISLGACLPSISNVINCCQTICQDAPLLLKSPPSDEGGPGSIGLGLRQNNLIILKKFLWLNFREMLSKIFL